MIKSIKLQNFKNHLNSTIRLDDSNLHALVGQNSSGKTTVIQGVNFLSQLTNQPFEAVFSGEANPEHLITSGKKELFVAVSGLQVQPLTEWWVSISWKNNNGQFVPRAKYKPNVDQDIIEIKGLKESLRNLPPKILFDLHNSTYLKLSAEKLAQAAYSEEVSPKIGYDGTGLAPSLDSLKYEAPEKFDDLQKYLKRIVPGVREVGIRRAKVPVVERRSIGIDEKSLPFDDSKEITGQEIIFNMNSGKRIPAHAMSEGTIITLGLLAVIMSPNRPNLLLLDDIEQGLHPKAQVELVQVLKKIIQTNPSLQIIFTTHSPYIIDELEPSQVHVLNTTPDGYAIVKRMDEHPDVQRGLEVLTTGEFWDAEGEEWILAGETSG